MPNYLSSDWLTSLFSGDSVRESQQRLRNLMVEADPVAGYLRQDIAGVDPEAVKRVVHSYVGTRLQLETLPRSYRSALRLGLPELFQAEMTLPARATAIYNAHVVHGYKLSEIAQELGLHQATVSKIFRAMSGSANQQLD